MKSSTFSADTTKYGGKFRSLLVNYYLNEYTRKGKIGSYYIYMFVPDRVRITKESEVNHA